MDYLSETDNVFANALWISTGVIGSLLYLILFFVILLNSTTGFYRNLTFAIAVVDFCCAFSGIFQATWYYKVKNVLYCVDYGVSNYFPDWVVQGIWIAWVVSFYGELIVITYSFLWRAVLISNSRIVRLFEHNIVFVLLALIACGIAYCDYSIECGVEYSDLTPLETLKMLLPATLSGLHFLVIAICALFINHKIKRGSFSRKMKTTHKKRLFVLSIQALNPLFLNFLVDLIYELALIAPIPVFLVSFIPFSSIHHALNALIILGLTSEHRKFIVNLFRRDVASSSKSSKTTKDDGEDNQENGEENPVEEDANEPSGGFHDNQEQVDNFQENDHNSYGISRTGQHIPTANYRNTRNTNFQDATNSYDISRTGHHIPAATNYRNGRDAKYTVQGITNPVENAEKADASDPEYQTLVACEKKNVFGRDKKIVAPMAGEHDPNYETLAVCGRTNVFGRDKKEKKKVPAPKAEMHDPSYRTTTNVKARSDKARKNNNKPPTPRAPNIDRTVIVGTHDPNYATLAPNGMNVFGSDKKKKEKKKIQYANMTIVPGTEAVVGTNEPNYQTLAATGTNVFGTDKKKKEKMQYANMTIVPGEEAVVGTSDPNYQTLAAVDRNVFGSDKKKRKCKKNRHN